MGNTIEQLLTLPYLGSRPYIHGTTIIDAFLDLAGDCDDLCAAFRGLTVGRVRFCPSEASRPVGFEVRGEIEATPRRTGQRETWLIMDDGIPHQNRFDDYESHASKETRTAGEAVFQDFAPPGVTAIQRLVSSTKVLLDNLYQNQKWLFVRLESSGLPNSDEQICISHFPLVTARVKRCQFSGNGRELGYIFFWCR